MERANVKRSTKPSLTRVSLLIYFLCIDTKYMFLNQPYFITLFCVLNSHDVADSVFSILRIPNKLQIIPWENPTGELGMSSLTV